MATAKKAQREKNTSFLITTWTTTHSQPRVWTYLLGTHWICSASRDLWQSLSCHISRKPLKRGTNLLKLKYFLYQNAKIHGRRLHLYNQLLTRAVLENIAEDGLRPELLTYNKAIRKKHIKICTLLQVPVRTPRFAFLGQNHFCEACLSSWTPIAFDCSIISWKQNSACRHFKLYESAIFEHSTTKYFARQTSQRAIKTHSRVIFPTRWKIETAWAAYVGAFFQLKFFFDNWLLDDLYNCVWCELPTQKRRFKSATIFCLMHIGTDFEQQHFSWKQYGTFCCLFHLAAPPKEKKTFQTFL